MVSEPAAATRPPLARLFQLILAAAILITLYFALDPQPPTLLQSDKSQHELAFVVLTLLSTLAFPQLKWPTLLGLWGAFGGLIELLQLIPALHRDSDLLDWLADLAAIAACLLVVALARRLIRLRPAAAPR